MEEEIKKENPQIEFSRKVQAFKLSEHYNLLFDKLSADYKRLINDLIIKENPEVRGAVHYLLTIYEWFNSSADLEELINIEKRKIEEDKDW